MTGPPTSRRRTLREWLGAAGPDFGVRLLQSRPDLRSPAPGSLAELAARLTTPTSVGLALDRLNAWLLLVAEALAALPDPTSPSSVAELLDADEGAVVDGVDALRQRVLVWGEKDRLHLVRAVRDAFGPYPGGLAPPSARPLSEAELAEALDSCGPAELAVLDRLTWSPAGAVSDADRAVDPATARTPVERLLVRRLLRPIGPDTVVLPREVALARRGGRFTVEPVTAEPPRLSVASQQLRLVDNAAAGTVLALLHDLEAAAHAVDTIPHRKLRAGGLGQRDVTVLAAGIGCDPARTSFLLECAHAAGLLAFDGPRLVLTTDFDDWAEVDPATRWRRLAEAWLRSQRLWTRSGDRGGHPLGADAELSWTRPLREHLLHLLRTADPGSVVAADHLLVAAAWHRPALARSAGADLERRLRELSAEAEELGLLALGAVTTLAAILTADEDRAYQDRAGDHLRALFPPPVDRLILQADLTAVAPGPLPYALARDLRLLADQESRGGGGVFRFRAETLRRALDAGWSAAEVHQWLARHSTTTVPQPLSYLVDDVARRHGSIRVGSAGSYLQLDDDSQVSALLARPELTRLGLRRLGPGVLMATADAYEVVEALRGLGHAATGEDEQGRSLTAPQHRRIPPPRSAEPRLPASEAVAALLWGQPAGMEKGDALAVVQPVQAAGLN